jgi:hypothetical protein
VATDLTGELGPFIVQAIFILVPPAFFAASIYMCLARIIRTVEGDHLSVVNPRTVTKLFVMGDWLSFTIQGNAAGLLVHANLRVVATALIVLGLAIQSVRSFLLDL